MDREIIGANPASGLKKPTREEERERSLNDDELKAVWCACDALGYPAGSLFRLLILTGARRDEVREMQWREVDLDRGLWTLPAIRSKNKRPHIIPLPLAAIDILRALPRFDDDEDGGDFIFTTTNGRSAYSNVIKPKAMLDKLSGVKGWTLHDLRRTVATGMGLLGISGETIARVLNHSERAIAGVTARYARADHTPAKRAALEAWANHVERLIEPAAAAPANLVSLRGSAS